jgi:hypothetical protein
MERIHLNPFYDHFKFECLKGNGIRDDEDLGQFYRGSLFQRGYGFGEGEPFYGNDIYGFGLGQTLSSLFNMAWPVLKKGLKFLGKSAVSTAANVAQDAIEGKKFKESAKEHLTKATQDILAKAPKIISEGVHGSGGDYLNEDRFLPSVSLLSPTKRKTSSRGKRGGKKRRFGKGLISEYPLLEQL